MLLTQQIQDPYRDSHGQGRHCRSSIVSNASSYVPRSSSNYSSQKSYLSGQCHSKSPSVCQEKLSFTSIRPHVSPERFQYSELEQSKIDPYEPTKKLSKKAQRKHKSDRRKEVSSQPEIPPLPTTKRRSILPSDVSSLDTLHDVPSEWESEKVNKD